MSLPLDQIARSSENADAAHRYSFYGVRVESELPLPAPLLVGEDPVQARIRFGTVPHALDSPRDQGLQFQASPDTLLLKVDDVGRFLVCSGDHIRVEPAPGADRGSLMPWLLGSCFGALLHQRGLFPLHSSAVTDGRRAVLFLGACGAGKSTLTGAFLRRGWSLLADDVSVLREAGGLQVARGPARLRLTRTSATHLLGSVDGLPRETGKEEKFLMPLGSQAPPPEWVPVRAFFLLGVWDRPELAMKPLRRPYLGLIKHTYRERFLQGLGRREAHFHQAVRFSQLAEGWGIKRPEDAVTVDSIVERIEGVLGT